VDIYYCDWCLCRGDLRACRGCGLYLCPAHKECPECETDQFMESLEKDES
jgi:hypothetical protein